MIPKKTLIISLVVISVCGFSFAQQPVDKEIGFDEVYLRKSYQEEGLGEDEINKRIEDLKKILQKNRLNKSLSKESSKSSLASLQMIANDSCINMGFENGNFDGWCRKKGYYYYYDQNLGYLINYENELDCTNDPIYDDVSYVENEELITCEDLRFEIVQKANVTDPYGINLDSIKYGNYALKLGNTCVRNRAERVEQTFIVSATHHIFSYNYAVVLEDTGTCSHINFENLDPLDCDSQDPPNPEHPITMHTKPYFTIYLEQDGKKIECSEFLIFGDDRIFDFEYVSGTEGLMFVKQWQENVFDLLNFVDVGDEVTIVAEVTDCGLGGHSGYAYFEASCDAMIDTVTASSSAINNSGCVGDQINFTSSGSFGDYFWTFYDNDNGNVLGISYDANTSFVYDQPGHYRVTYGLPSTGTTGDCLLNDTTIFIDIENCGNTTEACEDCDSFSPIPGKTYWLAAWVMEEHDNQVFNYDNSAIDLIFSDGSNQPVGTSVRLLPSGEIIDGWQHIIGEFTIPPETIYLNLNLVNLSDSVITYFDDVRVHPVNGNMKSFVYDPQNYRLMAELDENNYTTFYEYDKEGGLIRVKKETIKGTETIQETRSANPKRN